MLTCLPDKDLVWGLEGPSPCSCTRSCGSRKRRCLFRSAGDSRGRDTELMSQRVESCDDAPLRDWTLECRPRKGQGTARGRPRPRGRLGSSLGPRTGCNHPKTLLGPNGPLQSIHAGTTGVDQSGILDTLGHRATSSCTLSWATPHSPRVPRFPAPPIPLPSLFPGLVS